MKGIEGAERHEKRLGGSLQNQRRQLQQVEAGGKLCEEIRHELAGSSYFGVALALGVAVNPGVTMGFGLALGRGLGVTPGVGAGRIFTGLPRYSKAPLSGGPLRK